MFGYSSDQEEGEPRNVEFAPAADSLRDFEGSMSALLDIDGESDESEGDFFNMFGRGGRIQPASFGGVLMPVSQALQRHPSISAASPLMRTWTEHSAVDEDEQLPKKEKLGLWSGVVIPTTEFMWSVLIFIRFGFIVGEAGVLAASVIVLLCALCAVFTVISVSGIATNGLPAKGGIYYILTRALGGGIGSAISLMYWLGVSTFSAIEIVGSVQGLQDALPWLSLSGSRYLDQLIFGFSSLLALCFLISKGSSLLGKISLVFMVALGLCFVSVFVGIFVAPSLNSLQGQVTGISLATLRANLAPSANFRVSQILAFILPCFVGIFSGTNKALNLADPFTSIPKGGFLAIGISVCLYLSLMVLIGSVAQRSFLLTNPMVLAQIAFPTPILTIVGIYVVGFGSAMQCLIISSTVLENILEDSVLPFFQRLYFSKFYHGPLLLTSAFALPFLFIPNLENLAVIVTMCFLLCWGSTNLAAFLLSTFEKSLWRPVFQYSVPATSFIGTVYTLGLMIEIQWTAALIATLLSLIVAYYIHSHAQRAIWGVGVRGLLFHLALRHLLNIEHEELDDSTAISSAEITAVFRPKILAFVRLALDGQNVLSPRLLSFISQLQSRSSLSILTSIVTPLDVENVAVADEHRYFLDRERLVVTQRKGTLQAYMKRENVSGFAKVFLSPSVQVGQSIILQTAGLGEFRPNTVISAWPDNSWLMDDQEAQVNAVRELQILWELCQRLDMSNIIVKGLDSFPESIDSLRGYIDVWWVGQEGELQLFLAHTLRKHQVWKKCSIRLFAVAYVGDDQLAIRAQMEMYIRLMRIEVEKIIVVAIDVESTSDDFGFDGQTMPGTARLRETIMSEMIAGDRKKGDCSLLADYETSDVVEPFMKSYITDAAESSLPREDRRDLFLQARTTTQLKAQIQEHSSGFDTALVILTLPSPNLNTTEQLSRTKKARMYMELIEYLTYSVDRCLLVQASASKGQNILSIFA